MDSAAPSDQARAAVASVAALAQDCSENSVLNNGPAHRIFKRLLAPECGCSQLLASELLVHVTGNLAALVKWNRSAFIVVSLFEAGNVSVTKV